MEPFTEICTSPMLRETHRRDREAILRRFPALASCPHRHFLALRRYLHRSPERFFSEPTYGTFLSWLEGQDARCRTSFMEYMREHEPEISQAYLFLGEINACDWHDDIEESGDYALVRFIDQNVHPAFLRLCEGVFAPFLRPVAYFARVDRGKGTEGLDAWAVVQEALKAEVAGIASAYRNTVRNGIAHGGIIYLQHEIRYRDKQGHEEACANADVIRMADDMLDHCNAMALAYRVFLLSHQAAGYAMPCQPLLEELQEETRTPWWRIEGWIPAEIPRGRQLVLYACPDTHDHAKILISVFQSGVLAEFFAPGYDRYFFSLRSGKGLPGCAAFDGRKLGLLRERGGARPEDYKGVIEEDLVFYVPRPKVPRWIGRIGTLLHSLRLHWPLAMADMRRQLGLPDMVVRHAAIHRNGWRSILTAEVVVRGRGGETADQDLVRCFCGRIVRAALSHARQQTRLTQMARYLPLGFARVSVFRADYRRRRLASFGLASDLVGTVQVKHIRRIQSPDILGATIEARGKHRIAWNRAWLEGAMPVAED